MSVEYGSNHDFLCACNTCHRKPNIKITAVVFGTTKERLVCSECLTFIIENLEIQNDQLCIQEVKRFWQAGKFAWEKQQEL